MMQTQHQDMMKQLQEQTLQVAIDQVVADQEVSNKTDQPVGKKRVNNEKKGGVSPLTGAPTPPGRPAGVRNKLTNLRDAVIEAFDRVGGVDYLVKLANGTQSDRAAFTSLMNKVLPTQINQQVDGGIRLELTWLGGRQIGATQAQIESQHTQALDLERDSEGRYRIKDQAHSSAVGDGQGAAGGDAGANGDQGVRGA